MYGSVTTPSQELGHIEHIDVDVALLRQDRLSKTVFRLPKKEMQAVPSQGSCPITSPITYLCMYGTYVFFSPSRDDSLVPATTMELGALSVIDKSPL